MSDDSVKQRDLAYAKYLSGLSPEERGRINEQARKQGEEEHGAFHEKFQVGLCWICGDALATFSGKAAPTLAP